MTRITTQGKKPLTTANAERFFALMRERSSAVAHLASLDREIRQLERQCSDDIGYKVPLRGPQLVSALERAKVA